MRTRFQRLSKILSNPKSRASYIRAKLVVLVPAQIRALRLKSTNPPMPRQSDLAREAELHQSRISMFETPGAANVTLETLAKIAAGLKVGVVVKFVPFSEMLRWEDSFRADTFDVVPRLQEDEEFINPDAAQAEGALVAASSGDESNIAASGEERDRIRATNEKKPPSSVLMADGAAVGGA